MKPSGRVSELSSRLLAAPPRCRPDWRQKESLYSLDFQVTSFLVDLLFFFLVSAAFLPIFDRWWVVPRLDVSGANQIPTETSRQLTARIVTQTSSSHLARVKLD